MISVVKGYAQTKDHIGTCEEHHDDDGNSCNPIQNLCQVFGNFVYKVHFYNVSKRYCYLLFLANLDASRAVSIIFL